MRTLRQLLALAALVAVFVTSVSAQPFHGALTPSSLTVYGAFATTGSMTAAPGTTSLPAFSYTTDTNTGMYRGTVGDELGFATGGTRRLGLNSTGATITGNVAVSGVVSNAVGTEALPSYTFTGDLNTGWYWIGADHIGCSISGTLALDLDATDLVLTVPVRGPAGSAASPTFSFSTDSNSGMYSGGADSLLLGTGGNGHWQLNSAGQWMSQIGSPASAPAFSFTTDTDTGIYRDAANTLRFATGGTLRGTFDSVGLAVVGLMNASTNAQINGNDVLITATGANGINTVESANVVTITPTYGVTGVITGVSGTAANAGSDNTFARSDHRHVLDAAYMESGSVSVLPNVATATLTFSTVKSSSSYAVLLNDTLTTTSTARPFVDAKTITNCVVNVGATSTTQTFDYFVKVN